MPAGRPVGSGLFAYDLVDTYRSEVVKDCHGEVRFPSPAAPVMMTCRPAFRRHVPARSADQARRACA